MTPAPEFQPREFPDGEGSLVAPDLEWLASLTQEEFSAAFRGSAVKRAKWRGVVRNACVALGNSDRTRGHASYAPATQMLERLASSDDPLISEHARWALAHLSRNQAPEQPVIAADRRPSTKRTS